MGAQDYMAKPFILSELTLRVNEALKSNQSKHTFPDLSGLDWL